MSDSLPPNVIAIRCCVRTNMSNHPLFVTPNLEPMPKCVTRFLRFPPDYLDRLGELLADENPLIECDDYTIDQLLTDLGISFTKCDCTMHEIEPEWSDLIEWRCEHCGNSSMRLKEICGTYTSICEEYEKIRQFCWDQCPDRIRKRRHLGILKKLIDNYPNLWKDGCCTSTDFVRIK